MPLSFATPGRKSLIQKIGGKEETRRHLHNLGFIEGNTIEVVSQMAGNLIVSVMETRVAISKEMANRIMVEEIQ